MTNLITEARELCEKATPGPWEATFGMDCRAFIKTPNEDSDFKLYNHADAAFIARSRTLIPELCDALEKAEAEIEQMRKAVSRYCRNDCFRDACAGNEDVGIPDCPLTKYSPPLPAPPEKGAEHERD